MLRPESPRGSPIIYYCLLNFHCTMFLYFVSCLAAFLQIRAAVLNLYTESKILLFATKNGRPEMASKVLNEKFI